MKFIPAIDLMDGTVVRLSKGEESTRKGYDTSPLEAALEWKRQGARFLHIIDLDAAFGKKPNTKLILDIVNRIKIPVQLGGGIRSYDKATELLDAGVRRVILGSMAIKNPEETLWLLEDYGPERVVIALDHRNSLVTIQGWQETTDAVLDYVLEKYVEAGFKWFLVTNVDTDGMFSGPDLETFKRIAPRASIIASGGVSQLSDLTKLTMHGVKGVVVGKALYEGRFSVSDALKTIKETR